MEELISQLQAYASANISLAPWLIFGLLLLAGFNLPVSEDAMLFLTAILAVQNPDYLWPLFIGVYMGAFCSDLICYSLGRFLGPKLWQISWFAKMVSTERVDQMSEFYKKYGVFTLILGRFIPFGVRNGLFLTAGLSKMNFIRFALSDLLAATISCSVFFYLYYTFGETMLEVIKKGNIVIFSLAVIIVTVLVVKKKREKSQNA